MSTPRYLVPFHPKQIPHFFADVLVIGSGLAGLRAAMSVSSQLSVLVITKDEILQSNSTFAQGGIAGVLSPDDSFEEHINDTLCAGGSLCERDVVEGVVREGPQRIAELVELGTNFDRHGEGFGLTREGGHGKARVAHALGDATGKEIMRAMLEQVSTAENIDIWEDTFTLDLLTSKGACRGCLVWNQHHGKTFIWAKQTILATGGAGQLYRETTNPDVATADGIALAYRAGAEIRDMEFMQFHPTVLYIAGSSRSLITEAMRGEGAKLVDRNGHRFMPDFDPRAELAPRDVVSRAIVDQMERTRYPNVYLDLTELDTHWVRKRFPGIAAICEEFNIDIAKDQIPVRPGAHYMMGGVRVDQQGRTNVPGLWAVGEVGNTGLHGANRLASNSLLEAIVYGCRCGEGVSQVIEPRSDCYTVLPLQNPVVKPSIEPLDLADIRNSLKSLMWRNVGVRRDAGGLSEAAENIARWCKYVLPRQFPNPIGWELQNMLCVARLIIKAATARKETRGCHVRTDFPDPDDQNWNRHQSFQNGPAAS